MAQKPVQWVCTYCGMIRTSSMRPMPSSCIRKGKTKDGKTKPHTWVKR